MRCPECKSEAVARGLKSPLLGNTAVCYNCGYTSVISAFLEIGDKIKRDDNGIYPVDDKELTCEEVLSAHIPDENTGLRKRAQEATMDKGEKYRKVITGKTINTGAITRYESVIVDVYDVLVAFKVTDPAVQHAVKKLLAMGQRGHKDKMTDLKEAHWQLERAMQLEEYNAH